MTSVMAVPSAPEIRHAHNVQQQPSKPQQQQQRRKSGRRDPKQTPHKQTVPKKDKDVVIPPRQVNVDFNHGKGQQKNGGGNGNNNSNNGKSNNGNSNPNSTRKNKARTKAGAAPSLPNGQAPNFGTGSTTGNAGLARAAAEAMISSHPEKYAGSSFQSEPKAITLPKPSFLRR